MLHLHIWLMLFSKVTWRWNILLIYVFTGNQTHAMLLTTELQEDVDELINVWQLYMILSLSLSLSPGSHFKLSSTSSPWKPFKRHSVIFSLRLHFFIFCNPSLSVSAIHLSHSFSHKHLHLQDAFINDQQWSSQSVYIIDTFAFIDLDIKNTSDSTIRLVINLQWNWMIHI